MLINLRLGINGRSYLPNDCACNRLRTPIKTPSPRVSSNKTNKQQINQHDVKIITRPTSQQTQLHCQHPLQQSVFPVTRQRKPIVGHAACCLFEKGRYVPRLRTSQSSKEHPKQVTTVTRDDPWQCMILSKRRYLLAHHDDDDRWDGQWSVGWSMAHVPVFHHNMRQEQSGHLLKCCFRKEDTLRVSPTQFTGSTTSQSSI